MISSVDEAADSIPKHESTETSTHAMSPRTEAINTTQDRRTATSAVQAAPMRAHSRLNERPLTVDLPGMARKSLLNQRFG